MKRVIIEKPSNRTERFEVSITEYNGRKFLDIRTYYRTEDGDWKPTKKGASIPVEQSHEVYRGVKKVAKDFFDLVPPPGKEDQAEKLATNKKLKEIEHDESTSKARTGIQRRKKVEEPEPEVKAKKKKKKSKEVVEDKPQKKLQKALKKAVSEDEAPKKKKKKLKAEAAEAPKKKKKKKDKSKATEKESKIAKSKRPY